MRDQSICPDCGNPLGRDGDIHTCTPKQAPGRVTPAMARTDRELMQQALEALERLESYEAPEGLIPYAITALRARLARQEQEPVAYRHLHEDGWEYYDAPTGEDCAECQALYTAPPPAREWQGLTADELRAIYDSCAPHERGYVAAMVEAKLKERNA